MAVAAAGCAAVLALVLRDPHEASSWGVCPTLALLGVACPGCGGLRAVNDLAHGDVAAALSSNVVAVAVVVAGVLAWGRWTWRRLHGRASWAPSWVTARLVLALVGVVAMFTVLRNTPLGAVLAP